MPEAQTLLTVSAVVVLARPALNAAWRAGAWPAPAWMTWPMITCPTSAGAIPDGGLAVGGVYAGAGDRVEERVAARAGGGERGECPPEAPEGRPSGGEDDGTGLHSPTDLVKPPRGSRGACVPTIVVSGSQLSHSNCTVTWAISKSSRIAPSIERRMALPSLRLRS